MKRDTTLTIDRTIEVLRDRYREHIIWYTGSYNVNTYYKNMGASRAHSITLASAVGAVPEEIQIWRKRMKTIPIRSFSFIGELNFPLMERIAHQLNRIHLICKPDFMVNEIRNGIHQVILPTMNTVASERWNEYCYRQSMLTLIAVHNAVNDSQFNHIRPYFDKLHFRVYQDALAMFRLDATKHKAIEYSVLHKYVPPSGYLI